MNEERLCILPHRSNAGQPLDLGAAKAREILFQTIANGWVVSWQHTNLLGEYDSSDERLRDSVGITPPKISGLKAV